VSDESLNLREAIRKAREKANRERNRAKCKRYYRRRINGNKECDDDDDEKISGDNYFY
jgi:hypothetical protein